MLTEDLVLTVTLLKRFIAEAAFEGGDGRYYGLIRRNNGDLLAHHPSAPGLRPDQLIWADAVLKLLNRELHHDGAWVVVFTHVHELPPEMAAHLSIFDNTHALYDRYALIWVDEDGDPQFTVEWARGEGEQRTFDQVVIDGIESTAQKCEAAYELWHLHMREVLEPREGQTFKRAQGQRAPSATH